MATHKTNFYTDIDLNRNQLRKAVIEVSGALPSTGVAGEICYVRNASGAPYYFDHTSNRWIPMSSKFGLLQPGNISTSGLYTLDNGAELNYGFGGKINANRFQDQETVFVAYGGTASTGFVPNRILIGSGTAALGPLVGLSTFCYDLRTERLGVNVENPTGVIHIGTAKGNSPAICIVPQPLFVTGISNSIEFNGTGLFLTDVFGLRQRIATTGMNIGSFAGILPMSKGGTNNTAFGSGMMLLSDGISLKTFPHNNANEIPVFNGTIWTISSGSFVTLVPDSLSRNIIVATTGTISPLTLKGALNQTNYLRVLNVNNDFVFRVTDSGLYTNGEYIYTDILDNVSGNTNSYIQMKSDAPSTFANTIVKLNPNGGRGPVINMEGGGATNRPGGIISLAGGSTTNCDAGEIWGNGGTDISARGGKLLFGGGIVPAASGGVLDLSGGASLPGGHVITNNGGGSVNTVSGFIELGRSATNRVTIRTIPAGTNYTFTLPQANGTGVVTEGVQRIVGQKYFAPSSFNIINQSGFSANFFFTEGSGSARIEIPRSTGFLTASQFLYTSGVAIWLASGVLGATGSVGGSTPDLSNLKLRPIAATFNGVPVSSGICSETYIPYAGTIQKCTVLSTATGSLTFDISATGYAAYPNMTSLCGSNRPFLNNDRKFQDSTLTGWNTRINAGDTVKFSVASGNNLINQVTIVLDILVD